MIGMQDIHWFLAGGRVVMILPLTLILLVVVLIVALLSERRIDSEDTSEKGSQPPGEPRRGAKPTSESRRHSTREHY
jgi:hypothetical protein